ncbi:hypothetical protein VZT92_008536 [Zoarces viviparus]|uniref:C-type lectin domain-containing protein n=1 Tax=Zoarces viviparus TaxID=48416 RepID=A0AAW1FEP9_ZOAVI
MLLFLFLFGLALGAVPPPDDHKMALRRAGCPLFWYSFNGRCYKYLATDMTWADAEIHCRRGSQPGVNPQSGGAEVCQIPDQEL